jgi:hypothetical protein
MSAQEIISELPKLKPEELRQVEAKVHELLQPPKGKAAKSWGEALLEIAGTAKGLPADYAHQHDHYLHGTPKKR